MHHWPLSIYATSLIMLALPISKPRYKDINVYQIKPKINLFLPKNAKFSVAVGSALRPPKQPPPIADFWLRAWVHLVYISQPDPNSNVRLCKKKQKKQERPTLLTIPTQGSTVELLRHREERLEIKRTFRKIPLVRLVVVKNSVVVSRGTLLNKLY